jgi:GT2 family glycosyltransferase
MPRCSVIIPLYNKASLTRQCLDLLLRGPREQAGFEVIAADDGSTDCTGEVLAGFGESVRVVKHELNQGFARTCNDGARSAQGEFLVFLNNDTEPERGWLDALVGYAEAHPRAAVVGSKLLYPNGTVQHAGIVFGFDRSPRHIYAGFAADHPAVNKARRFQAVTAACVLVRRALFEELGGFDAAYLNSYEDMDLCMRLAERGWEVCYCPESVLYHLESATRDARSPQEVSNAQLFSNRWGQRVQPDEVRYYVDDGLLTLHAPDRYPIKIALSPLLGVVVKDATQLTVEKLLKQRSEQVYDLLAENLRLRVRLQEAEFKDTLRGDAVSPDSERAPARGAGVGAGRNGDAEDALADDAG